MDKKNDELSDKPGNKSDQGLRDFLKAVVPGLIDNVVDEANKMQQEGEVFSTASIGKLFQRVAPEGLKKQLQQLPKDEPKQLDKPKDENDAG